MIQYYIIPVAGSVEPEPLIGPYKTYAHMLRRARKIRAFQDETDSLFWLRLGDGKPMVEAFANFEINP